MSAGFNRRAALGGIAAGSAATVFTALGIGTADSLGPDAVLLALGDEFEIAWKRENALWEVCTDEEGEDPKSEVMQAYTKTSGLVQRIVATRASSFEGLRVKARAYLWCYNADRDEALGVIREHSDTTDWKLIHSLMSDLVAV